ncbi:hypothetical protein [Leptolyngbya sp. FACHB-261]|uniref:hypothetical protein n=1 Tax=Leptolyngbya sp. FACHB-261 TaxID=2692806 RepID=UPI001688FEF5|nr:hypothetical protein [Leptolyngbya sp. FACHB-261]MBD2103206.1 hypothetical protein [Leptolyngbya sp. FACHB-261]
MTDLRLNRLEDLTQQIAQTVLATTENLDRLTERVDTLTLHVQQQSWQIQEQGHQIQEVTAQLQQQGQQVLLLSESVRTLAQTQDEGFKRIDQITEALQALITTLESGLG